MPQICFVAFADTSKKRRWVMASFLQCLIVHEDTACDTLPIDFEAFGHNRRGSLLGVLEVTNDLR